MSDALSKRRQAAFALVVGAARKHADSLKCRRQEPLDSACASCDCDTAGCVIERDKRQLEEAIRVVKAGR